MLTRQNRWRTTLREVLDSGCVFFPAWETSMIHNSTYIPLSDRTRTKAQLHAPVSTKVIPFTVTGIFKFLTLGQFRIHPILEFEYPFLSIFEILTTTECLEYSGRRPINWVAVNLQNLKLLKLYQKGRELGYFVF
jgi:hypothetical protein